MLVSECTSSRGPRAAGSALRAGRPTRRRVRGTCYARWWDWLSRPARRHRRLGVRTVRDEDTVAGRPIHTYPMEPQQARELLARERARIERALAEVRARENDQDPDPYEASDVAPDLLEAELGEGLAERLAQELEAVERAERRLEEGTYGLSVESGKPIPDGRLEVIPWAERTAEEQARYEQLGR